MMMMRRSKGDDLAAEDDGQHEGAVAHDVHDRVEMVGSQDG